MKFLMEFIEYSSLNLDPEIERMINKAYLSEFFEELT